MTNLAPNPAASITRRIKDFVIRLLETIPEPFMYYRIYPILSRQGAHRYGPVADRLLFHTVSFETRTLCNGHCAFCLASVENNPRPDRTMPWEIFEKCIAELRSIRYSGRVAFFVNNEPLLDKRMVDMVAHARRELPLAFLQISTNGIKLTGELAAARREAGLNDFTVNSYVTDGKVRPDMTQAMSELPPEKRRKVRLYVRHEQEQITNRAGSAPNKPKLARPIPAFCAFPFTQINVIHDGSVSLCCNDLLAQEVMGNVTESGLLGVWFGERFRSVRKSLLARDRRCTGVCEVCDWRGFKVMHGAWSVVNPLMRHFR